MGGNKYAKRNKLNNEFSDSCEQLDLDAPNGLEPQIVKAIVILDRPIAMAGVNGDGIAIDWTRFPKEAVIFAVADSIQNLAVDVFGIEREAVNRSERVHLVSTGFAKPVLEVCISICNIPALKKLPDFSVTLELFAIMIFGHENISGPHSGACDDLNIQIAKLHAGKFRKLHGGKETQTLFRILFQDREFSCSGRVKPIAQKVTTGQERRTVRGKIIGWNASKFFIAVKPGVAAKINMTYMPEEINWRALRDSLGESDVIEFSLVEGSVGKRKTIQLVSFEKIKTTLF